MPGQLDLFAQDKRLTAARDAAGENVRIYEDEDVLFPSMSDLEQDPKYNGLLEPDDNFELVDNWDAFSDLVQDLKRAKAIALDTETEGLGKLRHRIIGYCVTYRRDGGPLAAVSVESLRNVYIPVRHRTGDHCLDPKKVAAALQPVFARTDCLWLFWNPKYDWHMIENEGLPVPHPTIDGMIFRRLIYPEGSTALKKVAAADMDRNAAKAENVLKVYVSALCRLNKWPKPKKNDPVGRSYYEYIYTRVMAPYGARDTYYTWDRCADYVNRVNKDQRLRKLAAAELVILDPLYQMERVGLYASRDHIADSKQEALKIMDEMGAKIKTMAPDIQDLNLGSTQQIADLFKTLKVPTIKATDATKGLPPAERIPALDADTMMRLDKKGYRVAGYVHKWRKARDLISKYLDAIPKLLEADGRIHASFRQVGTESGRLSSAGPNMQNFPSRGPLARLVKGVFTLPPELADWVWVLADLSQIEIRVLAHYSQEPSLVQGYRGGLDVHAATAADMFGARWEAADDKERKTLRAIGKQLNFSIVYGVGPRGLSDILFKGDGWTPGIDATEDECKDYIARYKAARPYVVQWINKVRRQARDTGEVRNAQGRRRDFPVLLRADTPRRVTEAVERELTNFIIQGSAADLYKAGLAATWQGFQSEGLQAKMINTIHDEVQYLVHPDDLVRSCVVVKHAYEKQAAPWMTVPVVMDIEITRTCWADKKEVSLEELQAPANNPQGRQQPDIPA